MQYKLLYTILNNIEVYDEPVPRTKKTMQLNLRPMKSIESSTKVFID